MASRKDKIIEMLKNDPEDQFLRYSLAMELSKEDETHEECEQVFRSLMADEPPHVSAFFMLGQHLVRNDRTPDAIPVLQSGIEQAKSQGDDHAAMEMTEFLAMIS